jgi:DNA-binding FadR family transcriptional regulator
MKRGVSGGTFVTLPSHDQITESLRTSLALLTDSAYLSAAAIVEVREMLEVPAVELAAHRRSEDELAAIRASLFDPATVDVSAVFECNRDFHTLIIGAAHNPLLDLLAQPVFHVVERRLRRDRAPAQFWYDVDRDHREILYCVEHRDQAGAREAIRAHLRFVRQAYEASDREVQLHAITRAP